MKRNLKIRPRVDLQIDTYKIVDRCVEEGTELGWRRAHKHTDNPSPDQIKQEINSAIMLQLSEIFLWPETS